jgi:YgiT-type zinc finger domain-containing protein
MVLMPEERECPMCGSTMTLKRIESKAQVPGTAQTVKRETAEWVCPDCDYFEEADEERS